MATLIFPIKGPMQSWGHSSNFGYRDSAMYPTKSAVIGLVSCALGIYKDEDVQRFLSLRFGVRIEKPGTMLKDFQVARHPYTAKGTVLRHSILIEKKYLADAAFLIGLEGDTTILNDIYAAFQSPKWLLYLGRKSYPITEPLWFPKELNPIQEGSLESVLAEFPWTGCTSSSYDGDLFEVVQERDCFNIVKSPPSKNRTKLILENYSGIKCIQDQPVSFTDRRFLKRSIEIIEIDFPETSLLIKGS